MKIVHLCLGNFYIDNYAYQENLLPKYHKKMGHDVTVIASLQSFDEKGKHCYLPAPGTYHTDDGIKVIRLGFNNFFKLLSRRLKSYQNTLDVLKSESPDLLYIHGTQFADIFRVADYLKKNPRVKAVADFHSDYNNSARNWLSRYFQHRLLWRIALKRIEPLLIKLYCITPGVARFVREMYAAPEEKIELLPLATDDDLLAKFNTAEIRSKIRAEFNFHNSDIVIIHGGKLNPRKKTIELIKAVLNLPDTVHLILFGSCGEEFKKNIERASESSGRIHFVGWLDTEKVNSYYAAADIACFPGTKSALWQHAIASGLPLICCYRDGGEYLDVGGNVLFAPGDTCSLIYKTLYLLINNKELLTNMSTAARTKGRSFFSYKKIAAKVLEDVM
jgi:1,2-diacylglycerol 3-alpha-glucosyltransferase